MTTEIATSIDLMEAKARRTGCAVAGKLRVWDVDNSTSPLYTVPGFVYVLDHGYVSRDEAVCYLVGCGPLCVAHADVRDHGAVR